MTDEIARIQVKCSNRDRVIGTFPKDEPIHTELICPGCGAILRPPGPIQKVVAEVKKTIDQIANRGESEKK